MTISDESAEEDGNSTSVLATLAALAEATAQNTTTSKSLFSVHVVQNIKLTKHQGVIMALASLSSLLYVVV